jgi:hypothetical protein
LKLTELDDEELFNKKADSHDSDVDSGADTDGMVLLKILQMMRAMMMIPMKWTLLGPGLGVGSTPLDSPGKLKLMGWP